MSDLLIEMGDNDRAKIGSKIYIKGGNGPDSLQRTDLK
jgi:hypothetical protein